MLREIRAQIGKLKEWLSEIFKAKEALRAEPQQPKSPDLSTLLFRYLDIQKAKGRKYSQSWQQQHTADELKAISKAVNLLAERVSSLWRNWTLPCPLSATRQAKSVVL